LPYPQYIFEESLDISFEWQKHHNHQFPFGINFCIPLLHIVDIAVKGFILLPFSFCPFSRGIFIFFYQQTKMGLTAHSSSRSKNSLLSQQACNFHGAGPRQSGKRFCRAPLAGLTTEKMILIMQSNCLCLLSFSLIKGKLLTGNRDGNTLEFGAYDEFPQQSPFLHIRGECLQESFEKMK
jgi:hypothetical protein